ncbi:hypothetical protein COW98_05110 [Candidatus Roizmanbacteria bacterium CG22_combo_CG10-13_8_21_14_all_35_9]|uniref:Uncharacterized protein n=4 Tax=Candidatus Roizmaniibacteriota TaxID=1752723 RepID=A0A2M8F1R0_9BACT|nr:MAG: hypothetical protein COX47_04100 [Candidatus Roizmanbacteria bacterium CG23_combo_of_CG06-09_8_20_14_all_35_49]PIP62243.1 MAG: hypothetical protein COW98_05110 [Candidatus Roizmanbacteria bacterium CG22_combo_CG10-13_8_21_14_all_35_9]PIY71408.1 MAG: hypothetical protein COY88_00515 [Candidatus Roizmanbacteria bacterium CG_4_10_14_0_8_um_filter_35_28]PJC33229.1 MAG: hypothetical protein CO048_03550 [Candidatus Roizmanbacteria bacterium CG_4_9_14_0_2_um_filter_35_15]PJC82656.1 MAG: hypoth
MKRKFFLLYIFLILLTMVFVFKPNVFAETSPSDLQEDVIVECITFTPTNGFGRYPRPVEPGTFTGTCSAKTRCDIVTCLPSVGCVPNTGFVQLDSGNNFFSPGVINEPGQLVNVQDHTGYYIYAAHTPEPLGAGAEGENATQQQAELPLIISGSVEDCEQIYWDPYGRVFDSVSLEPFGKGEAVVTLLDENGNPSSNTFTNNVLIDEMGKYNILINKDGRYKLKVTPKTNHKFTAAEPDIRYKDLYDFIYKLGDPAFAETAQSPKRVDVVLEPIGAPYSRSPDYISREYIDVLFKGELYTKIALRTVHPKTIVKVMVDGVELTEDGAGRALPKTSDKEGYWLVLIKKEVFSQTGFSIELIKNPQYYPLAKNNNYFSQLIDKLASLFFKKVSAQQSIKIDSGSSTDNKKTIIKFEPILEYIEGFSYDNNNKIIPRAKVNIKLKMNDKIYSSTTTDDSGFFTMYPKNLPPYEFYLEIINPETKKVAVQTTGEFVKKNQAYLDSEKINLIQATKQDQKIINPTIGELNNIVNNNNQPTNQPTTSTSTKTAFNPTILIIISVIALLVIVALGLVLYIKKSQGLTKPY